VGSSGAAWRAGGQLLALISVDVFYQFGFDMRCHGFAS
jgi:hypothetical protein